MPEKQKINFSWPKYKSFIEIFIPDLLFKTMSKSCKKGASLTPAVKGAVLQMLKNNGKILVKLCSVEKSIITDPLIQLKNRW